MQAEYPTCEWVNPYLEGGVWVLQAEFLDICARQRTYKMQVAPALTRVSTAYEG